MKGGIPYLSAFPLFDRKANTLRLLLTDQKDVMIGVVANGKFTQQFKIPNAVPKYSDIVPPCGFDSKSLIFCPFADDIFSAATNITSFDVNTGKQKIYPIPTVQRGALRYPVLSWDAINNRYFIVYGASNGTELYTMTWYPPQASKPSSTVGLAARFFDDPTSIRQIVYDGYKQVLWFDNLNPFYKYTKFPSMDAASNLGTQPKPPNIVWKQSNWDDVRLCAIPVY